MAKLGSHINTNKVLLVARLWLGSLLIVSLMSRISYGQSSIADEFLSAHNDARAAVGVGAMVWDDTVAAYAQAYAESQTSGGDCWTLVHSGGPYGENLGAAYPTPTPTAVVNMWVSENQYYDYDTNTCADGEECGHYTQVVWANSVNLGCAMVTCSDGVTYSICNYDPPGNIVGEKPY